MKKVIRTLLILFFMVIAPLLTGAIFYISNKPGSYLSQAVLKSNISIPGFLIVDISIFFPFENQICDILWAFALTSSLALLLELKKAVTISVILEVILELIQLFPAIHMTFDVMDIVCEIAATLVATIILILFRRVLYEKTKDFKNSSCDSGAV